MDDGRLSEAMISDHHFAHSMSVPLHKRRKQALSFALPLLFGAFCTLLVPKVNACNIVVKANVVISCRSIEDLT